MYFRLNKAVKFNSGQYMNDTLEGGRYLGIYGNANLTLNQHFVLVGVALAFIAISAIFVLRCDTMLRAHPKMWHCKQWKYHGDCNRE